MLKPKVQGYAPSGGSNSSGESRVPAREPSPREQIGKPVDEGLGWRWLHHDGGSGRLDQISVPAEIAGVQDERDLSARDRSIVTVASLIARNQAADMSAEFNRALENGVTPAELSEIITHLAF